jgi:diaminopimelate decarboxylase
VTHPPVHAPLDQFPIVGDELCVAGQPLRQLAKTIGSTPFYAYDRSAIANRIADLRATMPEALSLHYAVKANPFPKLVSWVAGLIDGFDVASAGEAKVALDAGMDAASISFAGPGKTDAELRFAIESGITLNIESASEFERTLVAADAVGTPPRVAVRINPPFRIKSSGMQMGGGSSPFGVDAEAAPTLLQRIASCPVEFRGLHIYAGSQNLRAKALIESQAATFELAVELAEQTGLQLPTLNIGGGFGIPYFPGEPRLDLEPVGEALATSLARYRDRLEDVEVILELGRYLVGEAGVYVCEVIDRKVSRGRTYLVTNGGLHHHLAASGNFGQVIRKNYPVIVGHRVAQGPRETVNVVGPLCTPLDILAESVELGEADVGDLIVVLQSGAYGYSASPLAFLGHTPPLQVLV